MRELLVVFVRGRGHEVLGFEDGLLALEAHRREPFHVMLLDWSMPGMSGPDVARAVRAEAGGDSVYMLLVTGRDASGHLDEALDAGFSDYLEKPIERQLLDTRLSIAERLVAYQGRRREAELKRQETEASYEALVENTNDAILSIDDQMCLLTANSVARNIGYLMFGCDVPVGANVVEVVPEDMQEVWRELLARSLAGEHYVLEWCHELEGAVLHGESSFNPIPGLNGTVRGVSIFVRNVTERRLTEAALERSQRDFREVIEGSADGVIIHREGRFVYVNPAFGKMVGFGTEELAGQRVMDRVHPDSRELVNTTWRMAEHKEVRSENQLVDVLHRDGRTITVEAVPGGYIDFEGAPARLVAVRDVTERRATQAQLLLSDRLASMGTLAAGVAHEVNNPLGYLMANLEFVAERFDAVVRDDAADKAELATALEEARDGAERVRAIVSDLNKFARAGSDTEGPVDLGGVIERAIVMTSNELRHRARLTCEVAPALPTVWGVSGRLGQVFVNLLMNAAQSLPVGRVDENDVRVRAWAEADEVVVEVSDSGSGIPAEVIGRVFDPFFTTKGVGEGTGLGLSICHSIVTGLGGRIEVDSLDGSGTVVRVVLRRAAAPLVEAVTAALPIRQALRRGHILIVDDEPLVGRSMRRVLKDHDVVIVETGREALERLEVGSYDLVFCDLMMPDQSGMDFFEELGGVMPATCPKVVFMTGGAFTQRAREFLDAVDNTHIEKPFDLPALRALVRERLAQS